MKRLLLSFFLLTLFTTFPAISADFKKGLDAAQKRDYATALREWKPLAEQGLASAQYNLGEMYYRGRGLPQDYKTAFKWFTYAADQGLAPAQFNLGEMYYQGQGLPQDYKAAFKWFTYAAEQGLAPAQSNLGEMYYKGQGVLRDIARAYMWFNIAASQGNDIAGMNMNFIEKKMTPADIAAARKFAQEWKKKHGQSQQGSLSLRDFEQRVQTYYLNVKPEDAYGWLASLDLSGVRSDTFILLGTFYSQIVSRHPNRISSLLRAASNNRFKALVIIFALSLAGHADRERLIREVAHRAYLDPEALSKAAKPPSIDLRKLTPRSVVGLDMCWTSFFATGDQVYVWKVAEWLKHGRTLEEAATQIKVLKSGPNGGNAKMKAKIKQIAIGAAAQWSITTNAIKHGAVLKALEAFAHERNNSAGRKAREIVTSIRARNRKVEARAKAIRVKIDKKTVKRFLKSAIQGDADAQLHLGAMY